MSGEADGPKVMPGWLSGLYTLKDNLGWISAIVAILIGVTAPTLYFALPHETTWLDWVAIPAGFIFGGWLVYQGFVRYRNLRLVEDTPVEHIAGLAMGRVHVAGRATGGEPLRSPFTETPCYYYYTCTERYQRQRRATVWTTIREECESRHFYLDDGKARVRVDPHGAEFEVVKTTSMEFARKLVRRQFVEPSLGIPPPAKELAAHVGSDKARYRFTEFCLLAESEVNVLGNCSENPEPRDDSDRNLISKGGEDEPFLITAQKERAEEKSLRRGALVRVASGAALIIAAAAIALGGLGMLYQFPPPPSPEMDGKVSILYNSFKGGPEPVYEPLPYYPSIARRNRIGGHVLLNAVVARNGRVVHVSVMREIGGVPMPVPDPFLLHAATEAVSVWRYKPLLDHGKPQEATVHIILDFHLKPHD